MNRKELGQKAVFAMEGAAQQRGWPGAADALIDTIAAALQRGESVQLKGFGTFAVVETKPRTGRNPRTGKPIEIPARRRVRFKPSGSLLS
jgi:nucleoid DNA-binding protein